MQTGQPSILMDYALQRVPKEHRRPMVSLAFVWAGFILTVSNFLLPSTLANQYSLVHAVLIVAISYGLLSLVAVGIGYIGAKQGLSTSMLLQWPFGRQSSKIILLIPGLVKMGWVAVDCGFIGFVMARWVFGVQYEALLSVIAVILAIITAGLGFRGLMILSYAAIPLVIVLPFLGVGGVLATEGWGAILNVRPADPQPMALGIATVFSFFITGAVLAADITRYAKRPLRDTILATVFGVLFVPVLFLSMMLLTLIGTGASDYIEGMVMMGFLLPAIVTVLFSGWTTSDNDLYSGALAFSVILEKPKWMITVAMGVITAALSTIPVVELFGAWLNFLGLVIPPFGGILLADYFLVRKGNYAFDQIPTGFIPSPWLNLIGCVLAASLLDITSVPAPLLFLVISAGVHWVLSGTLLNRPVVLTRR